MGLYYVSIVRIIFCVLLFFVLQPKTPREYFGKKYEEAIKFYRRNMSRINHMLNETMVDKELVLSIIFPELIRYSMWKDMLETKANELLYIREGNQGAFFSIGRFQIKPTFVEKLENYIGSDSLLKKEFGRILSFESSNIKDIRRERIARLKNYQWQVYYVAAFTKVVETRFGFVKSFPMKEKIQFFSSAYNHDFMCDLAEVVRWIHVKSFPYGMKYSNPFSYAEVALFFYQNDFSSFSRKLRE